MLNVNTPAKIFEGATPIIGGTDGAIGHNDAGKYGENSAAARIEEDALRSDSQLMDANGWVQTKVTQAQISVGQSSGAGVSASASQFPLSINQFEVFDLETIDAANVGFGYPVTDGRFVVHCPVSQTGTSIFAKFDTTKTFNSAGSWEFFDAGDVLGEDTIFNGSCFDGRYMYFAPLFGTDASGRMLRYDTRAPFTDPTSWQMFNIATIDSNLGGFSGCIFNDRDKKVYFSPWILPVTFGSNYNLVRFDTTAAFDNAGSWEFQDLDALLAFDLPGNAFASPTFLGQYLYLPPSAGSDPSIFVRYDTTLSMSSAGSYVAHEQPINDGDGFMGGAHDGRFIYFGCFNGSGTNPGQVRYDTNYDFDDADAWAYADLSGPGSNFAYGGIVFDGRYVNYVPLTTLSTAKFMQFDTTGQYQEVDNTDVWVEFALNTIFGEHLGIVGANFNGKFLYASGYFEEVDPFAARGMMFRKQLYIGGVNSQFSVERNAQSKTFNIDTNQNISFGRTAGKGKNNGTRMVLEGTFGGTTVTSAITPTTIAAHTYMLRCNINAVDTQITLPAAADIDDGHTVIIKDVSGAASTNIITINTPGSETIDGADTVLINTNFGSKTLVYNAANTAWSVV